MKKEATANEVYNNYLHDAMIFPFIDRIFSTDIRIYLSCTPQATDAMISRLMDFLKATGLPLQMQWYFYLVGKIRNHHGCIRYHNKYGFYMKREVYWWNLFMLNYVSDYNKTATEFIERKGSASHMEITQEYSKKVWYAIEANSDEALSEKFSHSFPEKTEQERYLECFCGNCIRERELYNVFQQY